MEKTTYKSSNPDKGALKKAIDAELKNASVEDQMLDRMYKFKVIELPLNYPYYNLENVRTTTACEEYAKKNNLPSDYFSRKNFWLTAAQDHYHEVIMGQLYETRASERYHTIFQERESTQTDKLYLTPDGILINGNSRSAWWRETKPKNINKVKYYVFDVGLTFEEMTTAILQADDDIDIREAYPWFDLAKNARSELENSSDQDITNIMKKYMYGSREALEQAIDKLELAEDFLSRGYKGYKYFSDLTDLGSEKGTQVFGTLEKGIRNSRGDEFNSLDENDREKRKSESFFMIANQAKDLDVANSHLAVQNHWNKAALRDLIRNKTKTTKSNDPLKRGNKKTSPVKPAKMPTLTEVQKSLTGSLTANEVSKNQKKKLALKELIEKVSNSVNTFNKLLNSHTDVKAAKKAFTKLESEIKTFGNKLNKS